MRTSFLILLVGGAVLFMLWPVVFYGGEVRRSDKSKKRRWESQRREEQQRGREIAGSIPIYRGKIFLITSKKNGEFILPKGGIKKGEEPFLSAGREAMEEAGVLGMIEKTPLLKVEKESWYVLHVNEVHEEWEEMNQRSRVLLTIGEIFRNENVRERVKDIIGEFIAKRRERGIF